MVVVATLTPHPNLHTVSSSVPMMYTANHDCHFDLSASSQSLIGSSRRVSSPDSLGFINGGFYSQDCEWRNYTRHTTGQQDRTNEERTEAKRSKILRNHDRSSETAASSGKMERDLKLVEIMRRTSVPNLLRPQTLIKLMRATSESTSPILNKENRSEQTDPAVDCDAKLIYASALHGKKKGGYFKKFSNIFNRKTPNSLGKLASQSIDEITRHIAFKINTAHNKHGAHETVHELRTGNVSSGAKNVSDKLEPVKDEDKTGDKPDHVPPIRSESVLSTRKVCAMNTNEDINCTSSNNNPGTLDRSHSLFRHRVEQSDSIHVSLDPGLGKRQVHTRLLYDFTTSRPTAEGTADIHIVKQATHVQSMASGEVVVTDILSNSLVLFDPDGHPTVTFSMESGSEPWATCLTPDGSLAVTLKKQGCVSLWTSCGEPVAEFGHGVLLGPAGIQCDHHGNFIVADEEANSVCVFNNCGELVAKLIASTDVDQTEALPRGDQPRSPALSTLKPFFKQPRYVCVTSSGNYVISDSANHSIKIFDKDLNFARQFGSYGRLEGHFKFPYGVACDAEDNLYIADHFNNRVCLFSPEGEFIQHLLTLEDGISRPKGLAVHHSLLYVTHGDTRSNKVSVFELTSERSN